MGNIIDYINWRGDIINNFNQIDALVLARLSYLIFSKISFSSDTIENISKKMETISLNDFRCPLDKELILCLGQSLRFKNMIISDYVRKDDKKLEKQFEAITIHLSDKEMFISFMGTDNSINGWKDDFNMSFMDNVSCQIEGKNYLNKIAKKYPEKEIYVGGHSKGGNVSIYACMTSSKIKKRIIKVYNFDGPGFSKNIIDKFYDEILMKKVITYIPESSIIGRMLNHIETVKIVKSSKKSIMAHNVYSWNIMRDDFVYSDKTTAMSEDFNNTLSEWLENTSEEKRKIFVNTIFEILNSTEVNTFKDIIKNGAVSVPKLLRKYSNIPKDDREVISEMIMLFVKEYANTFGIRNKVRFDIIRNKYRLKSKEKIMEIEKKFIKNK